MGSCALWQLAARGISAVGFERYEPGNNQGSSHGETRIIRTAYFESPEYVPLLQDAFALWRELEVRTNSELLSVTGGLMIGRAESELVKGVMASVKAHDLDHELLDRGEMRRRYPQHLLDADEVAVLESAAGYLRPEISVLAATGLAERLGARIVRSTEVVRIRPGRDGIVVVTNHGTFRFGRVIVCAGAWTSALLREAWLPLEVERYVQLWFPLRHEEPFRPERFPVFIHDVPDVGLRYGFPSIDGRTIKLAVHGDGVAADPTDLDREVHAEDVGPLQEFIRRRLSGVNGCGRHRCRPKPEWGDRTQDRDVPVRSIR